MAWAERLAGGKWRGGWRLPDGTKCYTKKSTHPEHPYRLKSDARAAAVDAEAKANRQAAAESGTLLAKTKWAEWWDVIAPARAARPSDSYKTELWIVNRYLIPKWGETPLNGIKHKPVQAWIDSIADGTCPQLKIPQPPEPAYVARIYKTFRMSMQKAVDDDVLDASPCSGIKLPKLRKKRRQHLTVDEAAEIGPVLRGDYRDAIDSILDSGLRPSELCGLHADRIDWVNMRIEVEMVYVARQKVIRSWPKDKDARRVPLTAKSAEILRRRLADRDLTAGCGVPHADGSECGSVLVFLTERGRPMTAPQLSERLRYAARRHKVPKRTAYTARRGYATRLARGGADPFAIAEVMGHSDLEQSRDYVQDEHIGPVVRAALGDREPLKAIKGGRKDAPPADEDGMRQAR